MVGNNKMSSNIDIKIENTKKCSFNHKTFIRSVVKYGCEYRQILSRNCSDVDLWEGNRNKLNPTEVRFEGVSSDNEVYRSSTKSHRILD